MDGGEGPLPALRVDIEGAEEGRTVILAGEIDLSTAGYVEDAVLIAMRDRPQVLVIDLRGLTFMDSTGVVSLLETRNLCRELGSRLLLVLGASPVRRVFDVSRTLHLFEISLTYPDAPGSIAS